MKTRQVPPPIDQIEIDFRQALNRLKASTPNNKELKILKRKGKLRVNIHNVAVEAGHSRTLLTLTNCRYPITRKMIIGQKAESECDPRTLTQLVIALRAEKRVLNEEISKFRDEAARQFTLRIALEKTYKDTMEQLARLKEGKRAVDGSVFPLRSV
jgi:hypothetical protein